jgi:hypothetical protein
MLMYRFLFFFFLSTYAHSTRVSVFGRITAAPRGHTHLGGRVTSKPGVACLLPPWTEWFSQPSTYVRAIMCRRSGLRDVIRSSLLHRREQGERKERARSSLLSYPPYELMLLVRTMIIELIGV